MDITIVPVTLTPQARVSTQMLALATRSDQKQELYDAVEQLSKERVGNLIQQHGSINSAAVCVRCKQLTGCS